MRFFTFAMTRQMTSASDEAAPPFQLRPSSGSYPQNLGQGVCLQMGNTYSHSPVSSGNGSQQRLDYSLPQSSNGSTHTHTTQPQQRSSILSRLNHYNPSLERSVLESSRHFDDRRHVQDSKNRVHEEERRRREEARRRSHEEARQRREEERRRQEEVRQRREEELRRQEEVRQRREEELRRQIEASQQKERGELRRQAEPDRITRVRANIQRILDFQETFVHLSRNDFNTLFGDIHRYRETDANRLIEHLEAYRFISLTRLCPTDFYPHFSADLDSSIDSYLTTYHERSFDCFTERFWYDLDEILHPTTVLDFMLNDTFSPNCPRDAKHIPETDFIRLMWHLSDIGLITSDTSRYVGEEYRDAFRSVLYRLGYSVFVRCRQVKNLRMNDAGHRVWTNKIYILLFHFLNSDTFVFDHCRSLLSDRDLVFVKLLFDCYNWLSVC